MSYISRQTKKSYCRAPQLTLLIADMLIDEIGSWHRYGGFVDFLIHRKKKNIVAQGSSVVMKEIKEPAS